MIRTQKHFGLQGAFKVDIYNDKDELTDSTQYFSNFITQSGLKYLKTYSFPDCFRFLSLGQGTVANSATGNAAEYRTETTGLQDPVNVNGNITVDDLSSQNVLWMGREFYFGGDNGACGTIATIKGPIFYRGWSVPTGGKLTNAAVSINEFAVSPSSGSDSSGSAAFSRVVRSVVIPANSRSIISYQLQAKIKNTGVTIFNSGTFQTGQANVDNDLGIVQEWENLSGYYKQVHHGLRCVDIEGSTYVPKWGDGMEPSRVDVDDIKCYFSPDNSQFDVSSEGGAASSEGTAYASDGLCRVFFGQNLAEDAGRADEDNIEYYRQGDLALSSTPSSEVNDLLTDIRLRNVKVPNPTGYLKAITSIDYSVHNQGHLGGNNPISIATPGATGYDSDKVDFGDKVVTSSLTISLPFTYSGFRTQRVSRKMFFCPVNALGHNGRFGSFVMAFKNGATFYPYIDALLYDNSGRAQMQHYRSITDIAITQSGSGISVAVVVPDRTEKIGQFNAVLNSNGAVLYFTPEGVLDQGLTDHSLIDNTSPSSTGQIYWPNVNQGQVIRPLMKNPQYSQSGFSIQDNLGYFNTGEQMIANLVFNHVAKDDWTIPVNHAWAHDFPNRTTVEIGENENRWNGFWLTTLQFTGGSGIEILESGVNEKAFEGHVGLGSSRFSNLRLTGYLGLRDDITSKCLSGTVTLNSLPSTYLKSFSPDLLSLNMKFQSGAYSKTTQGIRIMNSFSGTGNDISILEERLSGRGYGHGYGVNLSFAFTGLVRDVVATSARSWLTGGLEPYISGSLLSGSRLSDFESHYPYGSVLYGSSLNVGLLAHWGCDSMSRGVLVHESVASPPAWLSSTTYSLNDTVTRLGTRYISLSGGANHAPEASSHENYHLGDYWARVADSVSIDPTSDKELELTKGRLTGFAPVSLNITHPGTAGFNPMDGPLNCGYSTWLGQPMLPGSVDFTGEHGLQEILDAPMTFHWTGYTGHTGYHKGYWVDMEVTGGVSQGVGVPHPDFNTPISTHSYYNAASPSLFVYHEPIVEWSYWVDMETQPEASNGDAGVPHPDFNTKISSTSYYNASGGPLSEKLFVYHVPIVESGVVVGYTATSGVSDDIRGEVVGQQAVSGVSSDYRTTLTGNLCTSVTTTLGASMSLNDLKTCWPNSPQYRSERIIDLALHGDGTYTIECVAMDALAFVNPPAVNYWSGTPKLGSASTYINSENYADSARSELMASSSACSISFWYSSVEENASSPFPDQPGLQDLICMEDSVGGNKACLIRMHDAGFNYARVGRVDTSSTVFGYGTYKHFVVTSKANRQRLFVDGVQRAEDTGTFAISNLARRLRIGPVLSGHRFFIDEISVFNKELTASDVLGLYQGSNDVSPPNQIGGVGALDADDYGTPILERYTIPVYYTRPVYITSFTGEQLSSPQYNWMGHSYHTGSVSMSSFQPASGNFMHTENNRLLPNHGYPQYSSNTYLPVNFGGTYPALSFDNTLEMYMDVLWSADCGTALDCEEPA